MNGTQSRGGVEEGAVKVVVGGDYERKSSGVRAWELTLRALLFGLTLAAAIVLGTDKQTTTVPVQISASLPPITLSTTAKWQYSSAFVFFVVANAIACGYAALSFLVLLFSRGRKAATTVALITMADIITVALLFSGCGAGAAVGIIGKYGNTHMRWKKACNVFGGFCDRVMAAFVLSLVGSLGFVLLASFSVMGLRRSLN
ncbi:hypothetical protein SAY87_010851 [Trapa incisa]|uniref:CASP-like protein n=2 Tax=Trapa TaxID=22665 RepID=A0AAN7RC94_TRANT|nr:hypothetical protein SAY87_010851 [Trapa incisa]KAK4795121.1 hypothetical protein SAY86_013115 [Trapa natans]